MNSKLIWKSLFFFNLSSKSVEYNYKYCDNHTENINHNNKHMLLLDFQNTQSFDDQYDNLDESENVEEEENTTTFKG